MAYPDPRVKGTNPNLRVFDSWSLLDPFNGWWMLVSNVSCCGLTQTHGDPGHQALLWCFALMSKKVAPRLGRQDNHLLCVCYSHAVLLQPQNWNVILIAVMSHLSPRPVQRITYVYPCFSKFVQNLDSVGQKTAPMFAHFGKIGMVWNHDITQKSEIITWHTINMLAIYRSINHVIWIRTHSLINQTR